MEERMEQTLEQPMEEQTAALEQEVAALREEKRQRLLLDEARALLEERALSTEFAPLLTGADSAATRARVEQFERHYAAALQQQLAAHLPAGEPRDFTVTRPSRRRTGIRRI